MNETFFTTNGGGIFGLMLAALAIRAVLLRRRTAKEKKGLEGQSEERAKAPPKLPSKWSLAATFLFMSLWVIVHGMFVGLVSSIFAQLIPIIVIYMAVMAFHSRQVIADVIRRAKIRRTSQVVFLSVLSAVSMYSVYHYCQYLGFQLQASLEIFEGFSEATEEENLWVTHAFLDYALKEETGYPGFIGYMLYTANQGASLGRLSRSDRVNLGSVLTWVYWLAEFGIILGAAIHKGIKLIRTAFCESCGNWYGTEKHLGGTANGNQSLLLGLIEQKDFPALRELIEPNADLPSLEIYYQGCQVCGKSHSKLVVRHASQGARGGLQFKDAVQLALQPDESALLLSQLSFAGD